MSHEDLQPPSEADQDELLPLDVRDGIDDWRGEVEGANVWYGVVWNQLGRGDLAWRWWGRVAAVSLHPWVAAERAESVREFELHGLADGFGWVGLEAATDPIDMAMLRIGLVANAVRRADLRLINLRLESLRSFVECLPDSARVARQRIRLTWVEAEAAMKLGDEPFPTTLPDWDNGTPGFPDDYEHGSGYYRARGLLCAGLVRDDDRLLEAAAEVAPPGLTWAVHLARAERGAEGALEDARRAWGHLVPPVAVAHTVAGTSLAHRLSKRAKSSSRSRVAVSG